jgi:predicted nucleotidyltransferase
MLIKNVSFPTYLEDITDIENSNIDVFVELEDTYTYTVVVATAKNIESLMDKEKINYFEPGYPFIIVKKLTKEIITEAIEAYASDDAYWLKLYHFAGKINETIFNKLQAEHMEYLKELDELDNS